MGAFSIWHWLVVLAIALVIFGGKKLRNLGSDLGGAVKGFKEAMKEEEEAATPPSKELPGPNATATTQASSRAKTS